MPRTSWTLFVATSCWLVLDGCATTPTGRRQLMLVPEAQMQQLGTQAFTQIKQKQPVAEDPGAKAYVECVARAIIAQVDPKGAWDVVVFNSDQANAFALPGGKIGVYTGMLKVAQTPDQLAAVMAHEVAHVIARHGAERMSQNLAAQGSMAALDVAMRDSGKRKLVMGALGVGVQLGVLLPYSRKHESEADKLGQRYMAQAGFDPAAAVALWKNMAKQSGGQPPEFISTHPSHGTRVAQLQKNLDETRPIYRKAGRSPECKRPASI